MKSISLHPFSLLRPSNLLSRSVPGQLSGKIHQAELNYIFTWDGHIVNIALYGRAPKAIVWYGLRASMLPRSKRSLLIRPLQVCKPSVRTFKK